MLQKSIGCKYLDKVRTAGQGFPIADLRSSCLTIVSLSALMRQQDAMQCRCLPLGHP